jgi:hypothetical protein
MYVNICVWIRTDAALLDPDLAAMKCCKKLFHKPYPQLSFLPTNKEYTVMFLNKVKILKIFKKGHFLDCLRQSCVVRYRIL